MKTDAGWKLWTRKPSAAPAMTAASTPADALPRSNAMTANELAAIAQTPAARPSTPSEKFTTLMISTIPASVSHAPMPPRSTRCTKASVRIWIDLTAPAHPVVFRPIVERLRAAGHEVDVTARDYAQTLALTRRLGLEHRAVGAHRGAKPTR